MALRKRRTSRGLRRNAIVGTRPRGSRTLTKLKTTTKRKTSRTATKKKPAVKKAPAKKRRTSRKAPVKKKAAKKAPAKKRRTSRKAPAKKRTSRKAPAKKKPSAKKKPPAKKRRTSRVTKKAAVKKRRTSRVTKAAKEKKSRSSTVDEQDTIADTHALLADWDIPGYRVEFRNRMNPIGLCQYGVNKIISFSREWWTVMSDFEKKRTSIHEVAHSVVRAVALERGTYPASHGKEWKAQMRSMGIKNPRAKSTIANAADLARFSKKDVAYRCCGRNNTMSIKRFHSWKMRGAKCACGRGLPGSAPVLLAKEDERKYSSYLRTRRMVANGTRVKMCGCC